MKITLTFKEACDVIARHLTITLNRPVTDVQFIHKLADGSGELLVEKIADIDRVELTFQSAKKSEFWMDIT